MSERSKLTASHLRRQAFVYVRQSSQAQLERNVESTARQYALVERAIELGFAREQVVVIDEDLGISGSGLSERSGFARLAAEVALGHAGLVLGLEVSRLARNNADWYRLLDLCGVTDTVIGDADGLYHPGSFNDRLLLGLKGTMSEAELHVLRARLEGGIRNKAARGELRKALPVGLVWGEEDGEILLDPDEAVRGAIADDLRALRRARVGPAGVAVDAPRGRAVPAAPLRARRDPVGHADLPPDPQRAREPRLRRRVRVRQDAPRALRRRARRARASGCVACPQAEWGVLIWEHHPGFIDKATFERNRERIAAQHAPARARAGRRGPRRRRAAAGDRGLRPLRAQAQGRTTTAAAATRAPPTTAPASILVENRGSWCLRVGGMQIDQAVAGALLAALTPAGVKAALQAAEALEADHDAALKQWRLQVERASYQAERAERRYRQVEPEHRLVARGLERDWETRAAAELAKAEAELALREQQRPRTLTDDGARAAAGARRRPRPRLVGADDHRPRPQAAAALPDRGSDHRRRAARSAARTLTIRWRGGAITELAVPLPRHQPAIRTDEDTIALLERLAVHYDDGTIAGILNRQGRRSATGERFTAIIVGGLRRYRNIPAYKPPAEPPDGELLPVGKAADELGVAASTMLPLAASRVHRRRAGHPRRALADPRQRPAPRPVRRRRPARLRADRRRDAHPRRLAARPCCSVSSAANCKPSTSATDAEKACEYWSHKPKTPCSTPPP